MRVPLSAQPDTSAQAPTTAPTTAPDVFGIAAGAGRIDASRAEAPVLEVPRGSVTVVTSERGKESIEHQELSTEQKTSLPWLVVETPRTASDPPLRTGRPFLTLAKAITWDAASGRHVAELLFGLDAENGEPGPLRQAVDVRFGVSCDDVTPARAQITAIGPSGYDVVRVSCSREVKNERDRQFLELFAGNGSLRYPFRIPRRPGPLGLVASSARVLGFGFERLTLTARQVEEDGSPLVADQDRAIRLISSGGEIDIATLTLPRGASEASAEVRPSGIGPLELSASSGSSQSPPVHVQLAWPLVPIAAMLAGGALGGLVSVFRKRRRKAQRRILEGATMGLLVTLSVLVVPGLASIAAQALGTELGLFVIAALAGFAGVPLVDRAVRLVFPSLNTPESPPRDEDDARAA